jgi:DNA-binding response OmpR family regulator
MAGGTAIGVAACSKSGAISLFFRNRFNQMCIMQSPVSLRILVVEDQDDSRCIIGRVLRDRSHKVYEAADATTALALFVRNELDLVVCDIALPDFSGVELLARMREIKLVRAIALTGHTGEDVRLTVQKAGFAEYITKPVSLHELLAAVEGTRSPAGRLN